MYEIFKFIHVVGLFLSVGMITASLAYGWGIKIIPNFPYKFPYKLISSSVKIGLALLIISGLAMYSMRAQVLNSSIFFWIKMAFVVSIIVNNIWINSFLKPKSRKLSADPAMAESPEFIKLRKRFQMAENLSLILWYVTVIVSALLPEGNEGRGGEGF